MTSRQPFLNVKLHIARGRLQRQRGEGLLGYLLALGLFAVMLPSAIQLMQRSVDLDTAGAAAFHAAQISEARDRYVKDNYVTILANAAAGPVPITTTMLKNAGYLDSGISDNNVNNQTYETRAVKVTAGGNDLLRVLTVTSGGQAFSETEVRNIAAKTARIGGGYVSGTDTAVAQGYQGSYQVSLADYGLAPGAGHVAIGGFFNSQGVLGDYLYRNAIPGHPELNQMNTALNMGGNAINNVSTLTASGNITTTNDVQGRDLLATRDISAARNIAAAGEVRAETMTATGTIAAGGNITSSGTVSGEYLRPTADAAEGAGCSPNGLIAKNYAGLILSCQSGRWRAAETTQLQSGTAYTTSCPGGWLVASQYICSATPYVDITFPVAFVNVPQVVVTLQQPFPFTPCASGALDSIVQFPTNITTTGFRLVGGASPFGNNCGSGADGSASSLMSWLAVAKK